MPALTEQDRAEGKHGGGPWATPLHASLFHALLDNDFTGGLDDAGANWVAALAEFTITHVRAVMQEIGDGFADGFRDGLTVGKAEPDVVEHLAQVAVSEEVLLGEYPGGGCGVGGAKGEISDGPEALDGMIPIEDLRAAGKTHPPNRPDPGRTIIDADDALRFFEATPTSFGPQVGGKVGCFPSASPIAMLRQLHVKVPGGGVRRRFDRRDSHGLDFFPAFVAQINQRPIA